MSSTISEFWAAHPECWIPITAAQKAHADKLITETFYNYDYEGENLPGRCIYRDQFMRHFQRHLAKQDITEDDVAANRAEAADDVERNADELICYREADLVACLMPFKHLGRYTFIFDYLHNQYLPDTEKSIKEYPVLARFYYDTFRKWQTDDVVAAGIFQPGVGSWTYDAPAICESDDKPESLAALRDQVLSAQGSLKTIVDALRGIQEPIVSLSGGIDSMVALTVLQVLGARPRALHIIYGNRPTSSDEYAFIAAFCRRIVVPLSVYEIPHIRRDDVDREFYESVTRAIRFSAYKALAADKKVLLGHIRDDLVENIWTNFARGIHLDNLAKMEANEMQMGVHLWRPLLNIPKSAIYEAAAALRIPHLKNTTPSWCNRGKFREHFYEQTHAQYGPEVDSALLQVAGALKAQAVLIDRLLYQKIYDSWNGNTLNVEPALEADLDAAAWLRIFEHVCHKWLHVRRPSIHAAREFCRRLPKGDMKMNVGKGLTITLKGTQLQFST
jgi:tRNA(Ile)-lysidine synthetase-like protein